MTPLVRKLQTLLQHSFPGATLDTSLSGDPTEGIHGILFWPQFDRVDQIDRQTEMWSVLRALLSRDELSQVRAILTMTPAEASDDEEESSPRCAESDG